MASIRHGIDLVSIKRIRQMIERQGKRFTHKVFTSKERAYCEPKRMKYEHYAVRFAAKEALMKAASIEDEGPSLFLAIEVLRRANGQPYFALSKATRKRLHIPQKAQIELSLSHERELAIAAVLLVYP